MGNRRTGIGWPAAVCAQLFTPGRAEAVFAPDDLLADAPLKFGQWRISSNAPLIVMLKKFRIKIL